MSGREFLSDSCLVSCSRLAGKPKIAGGLAARAPAGKYDRRRAVLLDDCRPVEGDFERQALALVDGGFATRAVDDQRALRRDRLGDALRSTAHAGKRGLFGDADRGGPQVHDLDFAVRIRASVLARVRLEKNALE